MNAKLEDKIENLPATLNESKSVQDVTNTIVELERLVLKDAYENHQSGGTAEAYEQRDLELGGPNTRGLSYKLNLFRTVTDANFCKMIRVGVHGGNVMILGQSSNIDTALKIYNALLPVYERMSSGAFEEFSANGAKEEGAKAPNRTGWINQWVVQAPVDLAAALAESRAKDTSANNKVANAVAEMESELTAFKATISPPKAESKPRAPRVPKEPKSPRRSSRARAGTEDPEATGVPMDEEEIGENELENEEDENTSDTETEGEENDETEYPDVTYSEDQNQS